MSPACTIFCSLTNDWVLVTSAKLLSNEAALVGACNKAVVIICSPSKYPVTKQ